MNLIKNIIKLFSEDFAEKEFSEDDDSFIYKVGFSDLNIPSQNELSEAIGKIPDRDKFVLMLIVNGDAISYRRSKDSDIGNFLSKLIAAKDGCIADLKIEIYKKKIRNVLTIYSFTKIIETWSGYSIKNIWFCFGRILQNGIASFEVIEKIKPFHTKNICFFNTGESPPKYWKNKTTGEKRNGLNDLLAENCHFANSYNCKLIPDDFHLQKNSKNPELNKIFSLHCLILSLIYLFDITSRDEDNVLYYKLRGYRQISGKIKPEDINEGGTEQYYEIYQWTYNEGNLSDKIGLARNIITIHVRENNPLDLAEDVLSSIRSGYDIYLKQNISQYITTKEQVVESIHRLNQRANQIADTIALPFRNCLLAIVTFFASMTIIRVSLTQRFDRIFTTEILILSAFFILISMSYMIFLFFEINQEKERFEENYQNLKKRYQDILDKLDIKKIFNNDLDHKTDVDYIDKKRCRYAWTWSFTHLFLLLLILWLTFYYPKIFNINSNSQTPELPQNSSVVSEGIEKILVSSKTPPAQNELTKTDGTVINQPESVSPKNFQGGQKGVENFQTENVPSSKVDTEDPVDSINNSGDSISNSNK